MKCKQGVIYGAWTEISKCFKAIMLKWSTYILIKVNESLINCHKNLIGKNIQKLEGCLRKNVDIYEYLQHNIYHLLVCQRNHPSSCNNWEISCNPSPWHLLLTITKSSCLCIFSFFAALMCLFVMGVWRRLCKCPMMDHRKSLSLGRQAFHIAGEQQIYNHKYWPFKAVFYIQSWEAKFCEWLNLIYICITW